jgi:RimJ/RimL family protein N-acetyltransferase
LTARTIPGLPVTLLDRLGEPFTIRLYSPEDRPALELMYAAFEPKRGAQGLPPALGGLGRWLDRILVDGDHLLVIVGGAMRGHAMLMPMDDGRVELANFLHQDIRNRGIGTAINRVGIEAAHHIGYTRVWLCVEPTNLSAVRSYEKAGFRRLPGTLWSPEIEMEARLGEDEGQ